MILRFAAGAVALVALGGCSTIIEGRSQQISVNTNPPGATCKLDRQGATIATVTPTPGSAYIEKTKHDIMITCEKEGYEAATFHNKSGAAGATFGNIILGGGIGWAIDSATGSDNKYDSPVNITLSKK
jgi:hypothetical protein